MMTNEKKIPIVSRSTSKWATLSLLLSLTACLNSAVNTGDGATGNTRTGEHANAISPWKVRMSWSYTPGSNGYKIYDSDADSSNEAVSTKFTNSLITVAPAKKYNYRIYPVLTTGGEDRRPFDITFTSWPEFTNTNLVVTSEELSGLEVSYNYSPWNTLPADGDALASMETECFLLANGSLSSNPITNTQSKMLKGPTSEQKVKDTGCVLDPNTIYAVSCRVKYADGKYSASTDVKLGRSPQQCSKTSKAPDIEIERIQVSHYPGWTVKNAVNGFLTTIVKAIEMEPYSETTLFSIENKEFGPGDSISTFTYDLPGLTHAGLARLSASFLSKETQKIDPVVPKDTYFKSVNPANSLVYPPIITVEAAQEMGSSLAVGDFDCDGFDDLAVGFPAANWTKTFTDGTEPTKYRTGVVIVYYGSVSGGGLNYLAAPSLNPESPQNGEARRPKILVPYTKEVGAYSFSEGIGARFGEALAVGNFNRDAQPTTGAPCMDLAIGAPQELFVSEGSNYGSAGGSVYIAYGGTSGLESNWSTVSNPSGQSSGSCIPGTYPPSHGLPVGDNNKVIAVNAAASNCNGQHLYPFDTKLSVSGNSNWDPNVDGSDFYKHQNNNIFIGRGYSSGSSGFGSALASGDVDGDGYDELLVGAPYGVQYSFVNNPTGNKYSGTNTGAAFLYMGGIQGIRLSTDLENIDGSSASLANNNISPVKLVPDPATPQPSGGLRFGQSVAIGHLQDRSSNVDMSVSYLGGSVFIGAPGYINNRGGVAVAHWLQQFKSGQAGVASAPSRSIPVVRFSSATSGLWIAPGVSGSFVTGRYLINPNPASDQFGMSIATGVFRDPNRGRYNGTLLSESGVNLKTLKPVSQVLAVGAPSFSNGKGAVFIFSDKALEYKDTTATQGSNWGGTFGLTAYNGTTGTGTYDAKYMQAWDTTSFNSLYSGRVDTPLCPATDPCYPHTMITNPLPGTLNNFGSAVGVAVVPLAIETCPAGASWCIPSKKTWVNRSDKIDTLMVGAPGNKSTVATKQAAYSFSDLVGTGVSGAYLRYQPTRISTGNLYASAITGGYFEGRNKGFSAVVGAPEVNDPVALAGNVLLFKRRADSSPETLNPVDMAQATPRSDGQTRPLNISQLSSLGFHKAKPVGDLNCDGYTDVVFPIEYEWGKNGKKAANLLVIYGSEKGLVLNNIPPTTAVSRVNITDARGPQWIDLSRYSSGGSIDEQAAINFGGVGNIDGNYDNGRPCDDLMVSYKNTITFYGSPLGLIIEQPSVQGQVTGGSPQIVQTVTPSQGNALADVSSLFPATTIDASSGAFIFNSNTVGDAHLKENPFMNLVAASSLSRSILDTGTGLGSFPLTSPTLEGVETGDYDDIDPETSSRRDRYNVQSPICSGDFNGDGHTDVAVGGGNLTIWGSRGGISGNYSIMTNGYRRINSFMSVYYGSANGLQSSSYQAPMRNWDSKCVIDPSDTRPIGDLRRRLCPPARLFHPAQFFQNSAWAGTGAGAALPGDKLDAFYPYRPWNEAYVRQSIIYSTDANMPHAGVIMDRFGESCVSVGDVNGDGKDDLVVPLPYQKGVKPQYAIGNTFVLFLGSESGLEQKNAMMIRLVDPTTNLPTTNVAALPSNSLLGQSGAGLGDINQDGFNDFALSARGDRSFIVVYGGPHLNKAAGLSADQGMGVTYGPAGANKDYEDRYILKTFSLTPDTQTVSHLCDISLSSSTGCRFAVRIQAPTTSGSARFGQWVMGAGDVNQDGYGDVLVGDPDYSKGPAVKVGQSVVFFGSPNGITYPLAIDEKARCMKDENNSLVCRPLRLLPSYSVGAVSGIISSSPKTEQHWRPSAAITFRTSRPDLSSYKYSYTNFGSRAGVNTTDTTSSDFLICNFQRFIHNTLPDFKDLGACGVYY